MYVRKSFGRFVEDGCSFLFNNETSAYVFSFILNAAAKNGEMQNSVILIATSPTTANQIY